MVGAVVGNHFVLSRIPKSLQGPSIALITAGIMAMAFSGFTGLAG